MQDMQKLCPHGVDTGRVNTSRQMGQSSCSSDSRLFQEAISASTPNTATVRKEEEPVTAATADQRRSRSCCAWNRPSNRLGDLGSINSVFLTKVQNVELVLVWLQARLAAS